MAIGHHGSSLLIKLRDGPSAPVPLSWVPQCLCQAGDQATNWLPGCHLEVVNVVFSVKVNALGLFVDGHDRQSDIDGAMQLPLGDLGWEDSGGKGMFLDPWAIMSLRPLETKQQVHPHNQVTGPAGTSLSSFWAQNSQVTF